MKSLFVSSLCCHAFLLVLFACRCYFTLKKVLECYRALICFRLSCLYVWMCVCMSENCSSEFEGLFGKCDCTFRKFPIRKLIQDKTFQKLPEAPVHMKRLDFCWRCSEGSISHWRSLSGVPKNEKHFGPHKNLHKCSKCIIKQKLHLDSDACIPADVSKLTGIPQEQLNWILVCLDNWKSYS